MNISKNDDKFGFLLFIISCLFLGITSYIAFTKIGVWEDEIFSIQIIQYSLPQMFNCIVSDVHPPLYYLIYKSIAKIFLLTNITTNINLIGRFVSILPFYLLFILALTKIRKNFNWLTTGIFTLAIISMPQMMNFATEIRMYSWGLFFLTASFVISYEILNNSSDIKNWILLTILTICSAYTHYYCAIGSFLIYLFLLIELLRDDFKVKNWLISALIAIIAYIPWLNVVINQTNTILNNYWIPEITFKNLFYYVFFVFSPENKVIHGTEEPTVSLFGILLLFSILILISLHIKNKKSNIYPIVGIMIPVSSVIIGILISVTVTPFFHMRYIIPVLGIFWLAISIILAQNFDKKYLFIPIIVIMLIASVMGCIHFYDNQIEKINSENDKRESISGLIKSGDILIIEGRVSTGNIYFYCIYDYFTQDAEIITMNEENKLPEDKVIPVIGSVIDSNPDKKIYIISLHIQEINETYKLNETSREVVYQIQ